MNHSGYEPYGESFSYPVVASNPPASYPQVAPPPPASYPPPPATNDFGRYEFGNEPAAFSHSDSFGYQEPYSVRQSSNFGAPGSAPAAPYAEFRQPLSMNVSAAIGHETTDIATFNGLTPAGYGAGADSIGNTYGRVLAYEGGPEPYGARGTGSGSYWESESRNVKKSNSYSNNQSSSFNDFHPSSDTGGGIERFRVRLLPESQYSGSPQNVFCQVGLDGVKIIDSATSRTLRIYPLDTITSWTVKDGNTFTFWAKTSVDIEQRPVVFQSDESTTTAILDAITAACIQLFEMVGQDVPKNVSRTNEGESWSKEDPSQPKSKAFPLFEWMANRSKEPQKITIEKDHWVPDDMVKKCNGCSSDFNAFNRKHHCRNCGNIFCDKCTRGRTALTNEENAPVVRVCDHCLAEVTQHLTNLSEIGSDTNKESRTRTVVENPLPKSHQDLAKKLQEEMAKSFSSRETRSTDRSMPSRNSFENTTSFRKSSFSNADNYSSNFGGGYGNDTSNNPYGSYTGNTYPRMREVACPTCTVHLQVEVPLRGTETVECGVCHNPFLVASDS